MRYVIAVTAGLALFGGSLHADELNPGAVPNDAKWVIHINFDLFADSALADRLREKHSERMKGVRKWLEERYGIDPREDLHSLTLFSNTYAPHTVTAVLTADYDRDKVKQALSDAGAATSQVGEHALYTFSLHKHKHEHAGESHKHEGESHDYHGESHENDAESHEHEERLHEHNGASHEHADDSHKHDAKSHEHEHEHEGESHEHDGESHEHNGASHEHADISHKHDAKAHEHEHEHEHHGEAHKHHKHAADDDETHTAEAGKQHAVTAVLFSDEMIIFATDAEQAKSAIALLDGDSESLEDADSKLIANFPTGAIFYGAAIDLGELAGRLRPFPVLEKHEHVRIAWGQQGDEMFKQVTLVAKDDEVAREMEKVLEGFVALGKICIADSETAAELYDDVEIDRDGATVTASWKGDVDDVMKALDELQPRMQAWRKLHRERH